jgi:hypothetical protein
MGSDNSQSHPAALISDHELSLDPSSDHDSSSRSSSTSGFQYPSYYFDDLESSLPANPFTGTSSEDENEDEEDEKDDEEEEEEEEEEMIL